MEKIGFHTIGLICNEAVANSAFAMLDKKAVRFVSCCEIEICK